MEKSLSTPYSHRLTCACCVVPVPALDLLKWRQEPHSPVVTKECDMSNIESNQLFLGRSQDIMPLIDSGSVDLVYMDPPYCKEVVWTGYGEQSGVSYDDRDTSRDFVVSIDDFEKLKDSVKYIANGHDSKWARFMAIILSEANRILTPNGVVAVQVDHTELATAMSLMAVIFGNSQYRDLIIWKRSAGGHMSAAKKHHRRNADFIVVYAKSEKATFNPTMHMPNVEDFTETDEDGRRYKKNSLNSFRYGKECLQRDFGLGEIQPKGGYNKTPEELERLYKEGRLHLKKGEVVMLKSYWDEAKGVMPGSVWTDIPSHKKTSGWPTTKPVELLKKIVKLYSNQKDMVFDPFMGGGTTALACQEMGRFWCGVENNPDGIAETKRIIQRSSVSNMWVSGIPRVEVLTEPNGTLKMVHDAPKHTDRIYDLDFIYNRDGPRCKCGEDLWEKPYNKYGTAVHRDHVIPESQGGPSHVSNYQALCSDCNNLKGDKSQEWFLAELAYRNRPKKPEQPTLFGPKRPS